MKVNREKEGIEAQLGQKDEGKMWGIGTKKVMCENIIMKPIPLYTNFKTERKLG